jgi:glycosyltransferase involved in cell wall biosynthesis
MDSKITIAIPTYNRNEKLSENLCLLLPQLSSQKVLIVDNHSDKAVSESLERLIQEYKNIDVKVYRNITNIGISANFLRCFEYCETEWMWLLSDDDQICEDAIKIIEKDTKRFHDYNFFNYLSAMVEKDVSFGGVFPDNFPNHTKAHHINYRKDSFSTIGLKELISKLDSFVNFLFVSSGVYNIPKILPHLRIGYIYGYSLAPHIATVLFSIGDSGKVLFSNEKLVNFTPPDKKDTWSRLTFSQAIPLLMEVPLNLDDESFNTLFHKITHWFLNDDELYNEVKNNIKQSNRVKQWLFIQLIARTIFLKRTRLQNLRIIYRITKLFFLRGSKSSQIIIDAAKSQLTRI